LLNLLLIISSSFLNKPQLFKAIIYSKVSSNKRFLSLEIILAPWPKNRLKEAKVARICKYFLAIKYKIGYLSLLIA
jgi:hypothetical protein